MPKLNIYLGKVLRNELLGNTSQNFHGLAAFSYTDLSRVPFRFFQECYVWSKWAHPQNKLDFLDEVSLIHLVASLQE